MSNLSPEIIALLGFVSAVGVEILKDTGKHLGRKAKELYQSLDADIIELGINKDDDNQIIRQKLEAKPEINAEIQHKISDNQVTFDELLKFMKENAGKNEAIVENKGITNSIITNTVNQGSNLPLDIEGKNNKVIQNVEKGSSVSITEVSGLNSVFIFAILVVFLAFISFLAVFVLTRPDIKDKEDKKEDNRKIDTNISNSNANTSRINNVMSAVNSDLTSSNLGVSNDVNSNAISRSANTGVGNAFNGGKGFGSGEGGGDGSGTGPGFNNSNSNPTMGPDNPSKTP
jgi:hypothetical protein